MQAEEGEIVTDVRDTKIGMHVFTVQGDPQPCRRACRWLCRIGAHRWAYPGGYCECCGKVDTMALTCSD